MENVTHGKINSRMRGSFLSLEGNQTIRWGSGKEKKREKERKGEKIEQKEEMTEKEEKKKRDEENRAWRRKTKGLQFPVFRLS